MVSLKKDLIEGLKRAISALGINDVMPQISFPKSEEHGDYSSNIALAIFADTGHGTRDTKIKTPLQFAQKIAEILNSSGVKLVNFDKVEAVKPGFINFWISKQYLIDMLRVTRDPREKYGSKPEDPSKKVVVEYSSPNIAKPFTVGHLRSTIIGDAIANLLQANGWKVYRDNHLGDWGTQFGKQIYAIKTWGDEARIEKSENPVKELVALYVKFHEEAEKNPDLEEEGREWFKKLEDGDGEARRLWEKCVNWSLKEFKAIYEKLGVKFTENNGLGFGESFFEDKIEDVLKEIREKKLLKESEGAKLIFFQAKYPPLMILKKQGSTLYATRDLATDKFRLATYGKDVTIINEVGIEQNLYFRQIFEIEKMLGWIKEGQRIHVKHGHYRFKDEKMSTRKGNVIWLSEVLEEAIKRARGLSKKEDLKLAEAVGIGAIKWNDLKRSSNLDIVFDWNEILNMEGNSGPYLQYTFARTQSVFRKAKNADHQPSTMNHELNSEELSLLRALNKFPEIVAEASENFAPNIVCNYLFDLAQKFNLFYQKHRILPAVSSGAIIKHPEGVIVSQEFRLSLTQAVGQVLKTGLNLLGIQAPEKM